MTRWVHIYQRLPILERVIKKTKFRSMLCYYFISFYKDSPTRYARHRRERRKEESESNVTCSLSVCQCVCVPPASQRRNADQLSGPHQSNHRFPGLACPLKENQTPLALVLMQVPVRTHSITQHRQTQEEERDSFVSIIGFVRSVL
jgi:hypothetical protein